MLPTLAVFALHTAADPHGSSTAGSCHMLSRHPCLVAGLPAPCAAPAACLPFVPACPQPTSMAVGQGYVAAGGQNSQLDVRRLAGGEVVYKGHVGGSVNNALHIARDAGHQVGGRAGGWASGRRAHSRQCGWLCRCCVPPCQPLLQPSTAPSLRTALTQWFHSATLALPADAFVCVQQRRHRQGVWPGLWRPAHHAALPGGHQLLRPQPQRQVGGWAGGRAGGQAGREGHGVSGRSASTGGLRGLRNSAEHKAV